MKRFSKNFLSIVLSDAARRALSFLAVAYLARKIGTEGFGAVNVGLTVLSYGMMVSTAGLNFFGTREVARGTSAEIVRRLVGVRFINAIAAILITVAVAVLFVSNPVSAKLMIVFSVSLLAHAFLLDWYFQGKEEMTIIGVGRTVSALTYLLILVLFVRSMNDILLVAAGSVVGDFLSMSILLRSYRIRGGSLGFRLDSGNWKSMMKQALPLGYGSILAHLSVNLPTVVLGIMMTNVDAGVYNAASKLVFFMLIMDRVSGTLLLPATARLFADSLELLKSRLSEALKWIIVAILPVSLGGTLLASQLVLFVFGEQYSEAAPVFRVLIWYFFFTMIHTVYTSGLIAVGREKEYGKVMVVSAVLFAVSIIILTKMTGMIGTAVAVVFSEASTLVMMRQQFSKYVRFPLPRSAIRVLISAVIMGIVLFFMPPVHVILLIVLGGAVYVTILFITQAVTMEEVSSLLKRA